MSLRIGKTELKLLIEALDQDHESIEDAARAAFAAAEAIFEKRAKFTVVGQLMHSKAEGTLEPTDPRAIKVALGWYSTEGEATSAAESLWHNAASGDTFRCWVLPVHHGTPASLHDVQKKKYQEAAVKAKEKQGEKIRADIAARQLAENARAAGVVL